MESQALMLKLLVDPVGDIIPDPEAVVPPVASLALPEEDVVIPC